MRRALTLAALTLGILLLGTGQASAGTYTVNSCANGQSSSAWTSYNGFPAGIQVGRFCGSGGTLGGMYAQDYLASQGGGAGGNGPGAIGTFTLTAPAGTSITGFTYVRYLDKTGDSGGWRVQARADRTVLEECYYDPIYFNACTVGADGGQATSFSGLNASTVSFGIWCTPYGGTSGCGSGYDLHSAQIVVYSTSVTLSDPTPPDQVSLSGVPSGWQTGAFTVTAAGRDSIGIQKREVLVDGVVKGTAISNCDYTSLTPCASPGQVLSGPVSVSTAGLGEGAHSIAVRVTDAAGNTTTSSGQSVLIDNQPPSAPAASRVESPWTRSGTGHQVSVSIPAQAGSPIATIRTQACKGATCTSVASTAATGASTKTINVPTLPSDGEWTVKTWLVDQVGNEDSTLAASTTAGVDTTPPTATFSAPTQIEEGQPLSASLNNADDPDPSSGVPSTSLTVSTDGGPAVPFHADTILGAAGHTYLITGTVTDPAGNSSTYTRTVTVTAKPPSTTPTTPTTPTVPTTPTTPSTTPTTPTTPTVPTTPTTPSTTPTTPTTPTVPTTPTTPSTTPTTPTVPTTPTTPAPPTVVRVTARLIVETAKATSKRITVTGRASSKLIGQPVTVTVNVPTSRGTKTLTGRGRVRSNSKWTVVLSLPAGTISRRVPRHTVIATTKATSTVLAGRARRILTR